MFIRIFLFALLTTLSTSVFSQGFGIPAKTGGIGFGNLPTFSGVRFNFIDRNVEKLSGINVTIWQPKNESEQTGTMTGLSLGLPLAMGTENKRGMNLGVLGVGVKKNLWGFNFGGFGVGAGGSISGVNIGGLGIGAGGDLNGINIGGLGAGSGGDVNGINIGGLGIGASGNLSGFNFGGIGVGGGGKVSGITIGGVGVGASGDLSGVTLSAVGIGSGGVVRGLSISGIGIGAGKELQGIAIAGVGIGAPKVKAITLSLAAGSQDMKGLIIAPAYMQVGYTNKNVNDGVETKTEVEGVFTGISVSAVNNVKGESKGINIGLVNITRRIKGVQFGLINIVKENRRGLRVLPIFNTRFQSKTAKQEG